VQGVVPAEDIELGYLPELGFNRLFVNHSSIQQSILDRSYSFHIPSEYGKVKTQDQQNPFWDKDDATIASMQILHLKMGLGMLPTNRWCAGPIPLGTLEKDDTLSCLILKKIDREEMKFRRLGYLETSDGKFFEDELSTILEIV
jgi:hypothetical protein